jgi:transcription initiation factor IIF auxiliary subunit
MTIELHAAEKGGKHVLQHDLNFAKPKYESKHPISFKNPNAALLAILAKSGPVPGGDDVNGARAKKDEKKRKRGGLVDMDKLAEGLVKLQEDDLLQVVQMIHDNKSDDTYTKNDVERKSMLPFELVCGGWKLLCSAATCANEIITAEGEFHVDLYTLPDPLLRMLWEFTAERVKM